MADATTDEQILSLKTNELSKEEVIVDKGDRPVVDAASGHLEDSDRAGIDHTTERTATPEKDVHGIVKEKNNNYLTMDKENSVADRQDDTSPGVRDEEEEEANVDHVDTTLDEEKSVDETDKLHLPKFMKLKQKKPKSDVDPNVFQFSDPPQKSSHSASFVPAQPKPVLVKPPANVDTFLYKMNHSKRGVCLILNNRRFHSSTHMNERKGTDLDADRLEKTFSWLGFTCLRRNNVSRAQMFTLVRNVATENHRDRDCLVVAVLSHGSKDSFGNEVVYGTDYPVKVEDLTEPFKGQNCPSLVGKPKIFILQACRGDKMDSGVILPVSSPDIQTDGVSHTIKVPVEADCIYALSTVSGYLSWRSGQNGSWFIQTLCDVLDAEGKKREIMWILTRVNRVVAYNFQSDPGKGFQHMEGMKEMPSVVTQLTNQLYFGLHT